MTSILKNVITPKVKAKQYLVVKFIGCREDRKGLRCILSNWLNSVLDKTVFVRYPPPEEEKNTLEYIFNNLPVFCHWQTYLASVYYDSDTLEDAILYTMHYESPCDEAQSNLTLTATTNIQNSIMNELGADILTTTMSLTLTEKFKIMRPLVISILRSIDLWSDKDRSQSQAFHGNPHYKYLEERASTYAKFMLTKMRCINLYWTDAMDKNEFPSTSTTATHDVSAASKASSNEVKTAILELLFIMDVVSE